MTDTTKQIEQERPLFEVWWRSDSKRSDPDLLRRKKNDAAKYTYGDVQDAFEVWLAARATPVSPAHSEITPMFLLNAALCIEDACVPQEKKAQIIAKLNRIAMELQEAKATPAKPQSDLHSTINMTVADAMRIVKANHGDFAEIERAFTANAAAELVAASVGAQVAGEPIYQCRITPTHPWTDCRDLHWPAAHGYETRTLYTAPVPAPATVPSDREIMQEWDRHYLPGQKNGTPFLNIVVGFARHFMARPGAQGEGSTPATVDRDAVLEEVEVACSEVIEWMHNCYGPQHKEGAERCFDAVQSLKGKAAPAERQPQPAAQAAVPEGWGRMVPVDEVKQLCRDYSSRNGSVFIKDVESALDGLADQYAAPAAVPQGVEAQKGGADHA